MAGARPERGACPTLGISWQHSAAAAAAAAATAAAAAERRRTAHLPPAARGAFFAAQGTSIHFRDKCVPTPDDSGHAV